MITGTCFVRVGYALLKMQSGGRFLFCIISINCIVVEKWSADEQLGQVLLQLRCLTLSSRRETVHRLNLIRSRLFKLVLDKVADMVNKGRTSESCPELKEGIKYANNVKVISKKYLTPAHHLDNFHRTFPLQSKRPVFDHNCSLNLVSSSSTVMFFCFFLEGGSQIWVMFQIISQH